MGGVSGAFGVVNPSRSAGFGDTFRNINVYSAGKVTCQIIMILTVLRLQAENKFFLCCFVTVVYIEKINLP
jgi:hypothetical protein